MLREADAECMKMLGNNYGMKGLGTAMVNQPCYHSTVSGYRRIVFRLYRPSMVSQPYGWLTIDVPDS